MIFDVIISPIIDSFDITNLYFIFYIIFLLIKEEEY
jgi:hypothetical protein